jgi:hypothetical protein
MSGQKHSAPTGRGLTKEYVLRNNLVRRVRGQGREVLRAVSDVTLSIERGDAQSGG